jgi:hypothetical protein
MRFNEFKVLLEKKILGDQEATGYYTVGDSHAVGLANYVGKPWVNKGKNGTPSTAPMHVNAINSIPKGSVVLISVGANDTFASKPNPQTIASNVSNLVNAAKSNGLKVTYLLFPVGTRPNAEVRKQTREAIRNSIDVPIIDLEGSRLVDGVHADSAGYKNASAKVLSGAKPTVGLGTPDAEPGAPSVKNRIATSAELEQGPPYPSSQKDEVTTMQQSLQDLGYSVGRTGVDGKYGPFTAAAVAAFKKDYDLKGNGSAFGKESFDMLSKINAGQVAKVKIPTSVNTEKGADLDIPALTSVENVDKARKVAETFLGRTMNDDEWKHLIQTTSAESSPNSVEMAQIAAVILNRTRERYGGKSTVVGVVWAPGQFEPVTGHPLKGGGWSGPHPNFTTPVSKARLAKIVDSFLANLPDADKSFLNFTSANPAAYKTASGRKFLDKMYASGGTKIGGTVFGTVA